MSDNIEELSITAICWAGSWKLYVAGDLDLTATSHLVEAAETLVECGALDVRLDLARVTFADSAGWSGVERTRRLLEMAGADCRIEAHSPATRRISRLLASHPAGTGPSHPRPTRRTPPRRPPLCDEWASAHAA